MEALAPKPPTRPEQTLQEQSSYRASLDLFDVANGTSQGGNTGSLRVKGPGQVDYQFKPSVSHTTMYRRILAGYSNRENLGEFIASAVNASINPSTSPHVVLVEDSNKSQVHIASQYLAGNTRPIGDLQKKIPLTDTPERKQQLADVMVLSALHGDHDVNPGNILTDDHDNLARIDFGHAYNDLLRFKFRGSGGTPVSANHIIDFFNRETVDGLFANGTKESKVWAHYEEGLVPSQEMVNALEKYSSPSKVLCIRDGILTARTALSEIKDPVIQQKIIKSLKAIHDTLDGKSITATDYEKVLDEFSNHLFKVYQQNIEDMKNAAKIMKLQVAIDKAIGPPEVPGKINTLRSKFQAKSIRWFKTNADVEGFVGDFDGYVAHRRALLDPSRPKPGRIVQFLKKLSLFGR